MQNKTYEQMYADFKEFYFKKIRPNLPKYEKERKECFLKIVAFRMTFFFLLAGVFLAILSEMFHFPIISRL